MTRFKASLFAVSLVCLTVGVAGEVKARLSVKPSEPAEVSRLASGAPYCVTESTMRLYSRAALDNRAEYMQSLADRGVCDLLPAEYEYDIIEDTGELAQVRVVIDETEFHFWVEAETL